MRKTFVNWGLAMALGLPGGAWISTAQAEVTETAGSAAKQAGDAAKQAGQAADEAAEAAKSAGNAAEEAGEAAGKATESATDTASETASKTTDKASETASKAGATGKDAKLEKAVEARLERGDMDDGVDVQTKNGVVTLSGTVESEGMRERIVEATAKTAGVKNVNDHLKVEGIDRAGETPEMR